MAQGEVTFFLNVIDRNSKQKLNDFDRSLDKSVNKVTKLNNKKLTGLTQEEQKATQNMQKLGTATDTTKTKISALDSIKFTAISQATSAVTGALFKATGNAVNFTFQMDKMKAVTEGTSEQMENLESKILDLSRNTTKTTTEIANTAIEMGKLGFSADQTTESLEAVVKASEATGDPIEQVGYLATVISQQFGIASKDFDRVADLIVVAANKSALSVGDMITTFKYVGPPAAALGVDLNELVAVMMALRQAGLGASQMGTSLRFVLTNLAAPTERVQGALDELGLSAFDAQGKFKGLIPFIKDFQKALEGATDQQKLQLEADIGGKRALSALSVVINDTTGTVDGYKKALDESTGAADRASKEMRENLVSQLNSLEGSLEAVITKIVEHFEPALLGIIGIIKDCVNTVGELIDVFDKLWKQYMQPVIDKIHEMVSGFIDYIDKAGEAKYGTEEWDKKLKDLKETFKKLGKIIEVFVGISIIGYIFQLGYAITKTTILAFRTLFFNKAVRSSIFWLGKLIIKFAIYITKLAYTITKTTILTVRNWLLAASEEGVGASGLIAAAGTTALGSAAATTTGFIDGLILSIQGFFATLSGSAIFTGIGGFLTGVLGAVTGTLGAIGGAFDGLMLWLSGSATAGAAAIGGIFLVLGATILGAFKSNFIPDLIKGQKELWSTIFTDFSGFMDRFSQEWNNEMNSIKQWIADAFGVGKEKVDSFFDSLDKVLKILNPANWIKTGLNVVQKALNDINGLISDTMNWFDRLWDKVANVGSSIGNFFSNLNPFSKSARYDLGISNQRALAYSFGSGIGNLQGRALPNTFSSVSSVYDSRSMNINVNSVDEAMQVVNNTDDGWKSRMQNRGQR